MTNTVWRLRGSTDKIVECHVERTPSMIYALTVVFGRERLLDEPYPDAASATSRAMDVRERLLKGGGWTIVGM